MGWKWLKPPPYSPEFVDEVIYVYACFHAARSSQVPIDEWIADQYCRTLWQCRFCCQIWTWSGYPTSHKKCSSSNVCFDWWSTGVAGRHVFSVVNSAWVLMQRRLWKRSFFFCFEWTWFSSLVAIALQDSHNPFWCNFIRSFNMILRLKQRSRQVDVNDTVSLVESLGVTTKYTMVGNLGMLGTFRCQGDIWGLYLKTRLPGFLKNMVSSHAPCWSTNGVHCQHHQWNMTEVVVWVLKKKFWCDYCWIPNQSNHQEGQEEGQNLDILSSDGAKRQRSPLTTT